MFKSKTQQQAQGFSLVEVLVAILIATIFVTVTMQMLAIAAVFRVRAQEFAESTTWIQEDLENIKYQAANYQYTTLKVNVNETATVLQVASVDDFQVGDTLSIGTDSTNNTIQNIATDTSTTPPTKTITLTAPLGSNWLADTVVSATTRCNAASIDTGFADGLRDEVTGSDQTGNTNYIDNPLRSKLFTNKQFRFRRTTTISTTAPYNVLQISYDVTPVGGSSVAQFSTEVIPNAALQCP